MKIYVQVYWTSHLVLTVYNINIHLGWKKNIFLCFVLTIACIISYNNKLHQSLRKLLHLNVQVKELSPVNPTLASKCTWFSVHNLVCTIKCVNVVCTHWCTQFSVSMHNLVCTIEWTQFIMHAVVFKTLCAWFNMYKFVDTI